MSTYFSTSRAEIKQNPLEVFNFKHLTAKVFDFLVSMSNHYSEIYVSELTIAQKLNCSVRQVIRALNKLKSCGAIIVRKSKGKFVSNNYYLNEIFYNSQTRDLLAKKYKAFMVWGMASLKRAGELFKKNVTLLYCTISNNIKDWGYQDDLDQINKTNIQKGEEIKRVLSVLQQTITLLKPKQAKTPRKTLSGFNTYYHFKRTDEDLFTEMAEYEIEQGGLGHKVKQVIMPFIQQVFTRKHHELAKKQDLARQNSLKPKVYLKQELDSIKEKHEENLKKGGWAAYFASFVPDKSKG